MTKLIMDQAVITKASLMAMPEDIRTVFLLASHICNEIETIRRIAIFSSRGTRSGPLHRVARGRYWTILRLLIGKTVEGYEAIRKFIEGNPGWKTYALQLSDEGKAARKEMERVFRSGMLFKIRKEHCFHYPVPPTIKEGFTRLEDAEDCSIYTDGKTMSRHSTYSVGADVVMMWAMIHEAEAYTERNPDRTENPLHQLSEDALIAADSLATYLEHVILLIGQQHGDIIVEHKERIAVIPDAPSLSSVRIPPVVRTPIKPKLD